MSREVKIGLFAVIALLISYFGYNFLNGKDIFNSNYLFYSEYSNVDQLQKGAPILVNGLNVGSVLDVYLKPDNYDKIIVEIEVRGDINVPKSTIAEIVPTGLMGGKGIELVFDKICTDGNCAQSGDFLPGRTKGMLDAYVGVDKLSEYTDVLTGGLSNTVSTLSDSLKSGDNEVGNSLRDLQATLQNMNAMTQQMNRLMAASQSDIAATMANMNAITKNLEQQNGQISAIMANTAKFTGKLSEMDLAKTNEGANKTMASLETTLKSADQTMKDLSNMVNKMNSGNGTLSKLMNDKEFYDKINSTATNLDYLLQDFRLNPKRYTRILSRKQIPYTLPEDDPVKGN